MKSLGNYKETLTDGKGMSSMRGCDGENTAFMQVPTLRYLLLRG